MDADGYEELKDVLQDYKIENDGIWLSWGDLWRIDGMAVRNGQHALKEGEIGIPVFQSYVGWRILIEELSKQINP